MLTAILLLYVGSVIQAPTAYFVMCGILIFVRLIQYGISMYKMGSGD